MRYERPRILTLHAILITLALSILILSCQNNEPTNPDTSDFQSSVVVAKWYDNHAAAISLTYDSGSPESPRDREVQEYILENNMILDYELVTDYISEKKLEHILGTMIPLGFQFFGHGHKHINHDALSYTEALQSFALCYQTMEGLGLRPIAYAYPGGYGHRDSTRLALASSGFLCGRLHNVADHQDPYVLPDSATEPKDWFGLPSLVMQAYEFANNELAINSTDELIPFLDETINKTAWLITTYHSIGNEEGWGFYFMSDFMEDLEEIRSRDFWIASMNDVTLYIRERSNAVLSYDFITDSSGKIQEITILLSDELPNDLYDHPLTILFQVPEEWLGKTVGIFQSDTLLEETTFDCIDGVISLQPNERSYTLGLKRD